MPSFQIPESQLRAMGQQQAYTREQLMSVPAQVDPAPQGVHAQIDNIMKELDLLLEELTTVRDCFGSVLKAKAEAEAEHDSSAVPHPVQNRQVQSPAQLQLMVVLNRITEYRLTLRDMRARSDL